jgi:hypothetical protein
MEPRKYSVEEIQEIAGALGITQKNDPASTTLTAPTLHGVFPGNSAQYGLFSSPGIRPDMFSALSRPRSFASILRPQRSEYLDEMLEIATGQTLGSGTNATGWCGNPPTVGQLKVCKQIFGFGNYLIKTDLNALPEVGALRNRADVPRNILNAGAAANPLIPELLFKMANTRDQLAYEMFRIGVDLQRTLETVLITGDSTQAYSATDLGWWKEFAGLDGQIKTGYVDAATGIACPATDSAVITFGVDVAATIAGGDGRNVTQSIGDLWYGLQDRAMGVGMDGVEFVWIMRKEAFRSIVENIACQYQNYRCQSSNAGQPFATDSRDSNELRLAMLNGQYLLTDGVPVPVLFSEGIPQSTPAANTLMSDAYLAPLSWQGMPLLRLEYFDMNNEYTTNMRAAFNGANIDTLNDGMYLVGRRDTALCVEWHLAAKMRLILETPFLAGRLDDIQYAFNAPIRNALPGASFYAGGGVTYRS